MKPFSSLGFDEPVYSDPLFKYGLPVGVILSAVGSIVDDGPLGDRILEFIAGVIFFLLFICGVVLSAARAIYRSRIKRRQN